MLGLTALSNLYVHWGFPRYAYFWQLIGGRTYLGRPKVLEFPPLSFDFPRYPTVFVVCSAAVRVCISLGWLVRAYFLVYRHSRTVLYIATELKPMFDRTASPTI